jgi:hypothetical protein
VKSKTAILLLAVLIIATVPAAAVWWLLTHGTAHIPLHQQQLQVHMRNDIPVSVQVTHARGLDQPISTKGIPVRLNEQLKLDVDFDTEVPLALTVHYQDRIAVKAQVPIDTTVETRVWGVTLRLPIKGTIPLDLSVPIQLDIPIEQQVRLKFTAPITARIDQTVHIPLRADLDARINFGSAPLALSITDSELTLPLGDVRVTGRR